MNSLPNARSRLSVMILLVAVTTSIAAIGIGRSSDVTTTVAIVAAPIQPCCEATLESSIQNLLAMQRSSQIEVVAPSYATQSLIAARIESVAGYHLSTSAEYTLGGQVLAWRHRYLTLTTVNAPVAPVVVAPAAPTEQVAISDDYVNLPIILYHTTPPDFSAQLSALRDRGYTTVTFDQVRNAWAGGAALPAKPVILTFDDGFADQMNAFALLQQYQMRATFYIINGGAASLWCIGAGRRYNDPVQPSSGCGDSYLSWDQVRQLDQSGLITIGGHTLDHLNLAGQSADVQRSEIADGKAGIEAEIGHPINDFAYPYGSYNQTTINITAAAGYKTAVTTNGSTYQDTNSLYTLNRIRTTLNLP